MRRTTYARGIIAAGLGLIALVAQAAPDGTETVRNNIRAEYPNVKIESISAMAVPAWYRVRSAGNRIWVNEAATYMLRGNLVDLEVAQKFAANGMTTAQVEQESSEPAKQFETPSALRQALAQRYDMTAIEDIRPSAAPGWFKGRTGDRIRYISADARFVVTGELVDMKARKNLTPRDQRAARVSILDTVAEDSFITYEPDGEARGTITVFTDTTCPYCQAYHSRLMRLVHNHGVRVRYAMYPRKGPKSDGAMQLRRVWCADDPQEAIADAYMGREFEWGGCDDPLMRHIEVLQALNVRATPTTVTEDGEQFQGARSVATVLERMGLEPRQASR